MHWRDINNDVVVSHPRRQSSILRVNTGSSITPSSTIIIINYLHS